jgi:hypothetical protein
MADLSYPFLWFCSRRFCGFRVRIRSMEIPARTIHLESSGSATQLVRFNYLCLRALTFLPYPLKTLSNAYPHRTSPSVSGNCAAIYCDTRVQERISIGDRVETWGQISRYAGSREEWEPMRFWSQVLSKRQMEGLYEVHDRCEHLNAQGFLVPESLSKVLNVM